jgi:predicted Zn finger-like uncharacterized protein
MLPKVAYMDSFSGRDDDDTGDSSSPQIVVSCPSCSTRFSVDSDAVSAMEQPRFHCSRCDAIFGVAQAKLHEQQAAPELRKQTQHAAEARPRTPYGTSRASAATPTIKPSDFSLSGEAPVAAVEPSVCREPSQAAMQPLSESPRSTVSGGWELFPSEPAETPAHEEIIEEVDIKNPFTTPSAPPKDILVESIRSNPVTHSQLETARAPGNLSPLFERLFGSFSPQSQGLIFMSTPLVAALALLLVFSYSSRISPVTIGATARWISPSFLSSAVPKLPPPGVSVKGLTLSYTKTQTRELIPVISGTVVNNTSETVDGVTLEGLGFNERGEVLLSSQSPLRSALSREKVSDLPLETVKKFQVSLSARKASIAPKEEVPFTLALLGRRDSSTNIEDTDLSALKYFSARVFSVK